ncbi:uncharacterized protein LAJ45_11479 [Morchella importuna]|uniref:Ubiquitin 3 binding protein But2 C-terminal domain-containing protein n=1 Tax=Morchella conica CCBAS932 TaxID=1392247 RepID=A0A3N4K9G0_9PEZI|nr:uncharacterized protein LAJ45_11479 [Morchella importuna]KAH8144504.1 hypothetical protein LAJ45_11479 [Morchella importuna]RPB07083.1 hypothetical protein P167DRAFT_540395 [Morchella conica CCBAS932]
MKFSIFASLLAFTGLVSCAPVPDVEIERRAVTLIYPSLAVNIFTPSNGVVMGDVYVFRYTAQGIQHETNSLLSFDFPSGYGGKTCSFSFANGWAQPPSEVSNSRKVQLFSVGGPISATNTYTSRPYRNVSYGIFSVTSNGAVGTWDGQTPTFPCPASATTIGFEVAPQGDYDDVSWPLKAGLAVVVL